MVARLWDMATQIEDGNVSQAEQALRQAQEALRQALERGASDEELKKLMDNLRAAMDKFLQALAAADAEESDSSSRVRSTAIPACCASRTSTAMLDRLENLARSGNREAAQRLLEQLQSMLENLQMAQQGARRGGDDDMMSALDELGDMIRKQQQLRDKTFKQGQDLRRDRPPRGAGPQRLGDLRQDQQALRERLKKLLEQLRQHGLGQNPQQGQQGQKGQKGNQMGQLGEAGKAMGEAEGELGEGDADSAVDSQGRALELHAQGRAEPGAVDAAERLRPRAQRPARARPPARRRTTPIRSAARCTGANMATTPR